MMKYSVVKLNHARKLLTQFATEYKCFIGTNYQLVKEQDKKTGQFSVKLRIKQELPEDWGPTIGDIVHNTRSSLDLLVTDLLARNGKKPTTKSAFPIFTTEKEFLDQGPQKVEGVHDDVWELIKEIKPYKEGNLELWQLHQIDIVDKHRIIIPVVCEHKSVIIDFGARMKHLFGDKVGDVPAMPISLVPTDRKVYDGIVLFTADKTFEVPNFEFELVFGDDNILAGQSISTYLNDFITLVEYTIEKFEVVLGI